jgi:glucose/arabinose dehydrogenase
LSALYKASCMRVALARLLAGLSLTILVATVSAQPKLPEKFTAVDTGRLLGSPDPLPLEAERVFPNLKFQRPVELTHAGDGTGRIFVVEQPGVVRVFDERRKEIDNTTVFLDIRDIVLSKGNEEGLLGLAFHPKYKQNGIFFVYYCAKPRKNVLARYRVSPDDPNRADPKSETRLIEIDDPYENHNGGSIRFGNDGYLYVGLGDGGLRDDPHGNGQNLGTLLGSILRIDVDRQDRGLEYAIPKDNPFALARAARFGPMVCAMCGGWRSIARPATCGPAMSARIASRKSISSSAAATMAGTCAKRCTTSFPRLPTSAPT